MAIFGSEPTFLEILTSYIYNYVILATVFSLIFVYYLLRTKAPLKGDESDEIGQDVDSQEKKHSHALVANGDLDVARGEEELLSAVLDGMNLADAVVAEDEAGEKHEFQKVVRSRRATDNEEEEENGELPPRKRQIIREVTVRKIFLPPDANYSDVENAAKRLIGDGESAATRKDSGTGGAEFRAAIRNIRDASQRLEYDDLSPVSNSHSM